MWTTVNLWRDHPNWTRLNGVDYGSEIGLCRQVQNLTNKRRELRQIFIIAKRKGTSERYHVKDQGYYYILYITLYQIKRRLVKNKSQSKANIMDTEVIFLFFFF